MQDLKEFVFILLVIAVFIASVQWLLLRFTHWSVALAATGFISFIIAFIYVSLKNATPNGGSYGPGFSEYITPTLVAFTVLFCGFLLVSLLTPHRLPKIAYMLPIILVAVLAIGRFIYQEVGNATIYYDLFSDCDVEVINETGTSNLQEIGFKNTSSGLVSLIKLNSKEPGVSAMIRQSDQIFFLSNSSKINRLSRQEFPFDYSICKEEEKDSPTFFFWLQATKILPIKIVLLPNEKINLFVGGNFVKQYQLSDSDVQE